MMKGGAQTTLCGPAAVEASAGNYRPKPVRGEVFVNQQAVSLTVEKTADCPLLKTGDRWLLLGPEICAPAGVRLCAYALSSLTPQIHKLLARTPPDAPLPPPVTALKCGEAGCAAEFRWERLPRAEAEMLRQNASAAPAASPTSSVSPADDKPTVVEGLREAPLLAGGGTARKRRLLTRRMERGAQAAGAVLRDAGRPFFSRLPKEIVADFIAAADLELYGPGEVIIRQGVAGEKLYVVGEGEVEVARADPDGEGETLIVVLGKGECFGEMSLLTGAPTSAEVRARTAVSAPAVRREKLEKLFTQHPALHRIFSKLLADRLQAANVSLENEAGRAFVGRLSMLSLVDLVQTLHTAGRTGTLTLKRAEVEARLGFLDGRLVAAVLEAEAGEEGGEDAFYRVMTWDDGDFSFEEVGPEPRGAVYAETMALLMEGLRRLDEVRRAAAVEEGA